jgi:hypothetical protein
MKRQAFDWSKLDRYTLISVLNGARKEIVGQKLLIEDLHKILSHQVKKHLPIKTKMIRNPGQEEREIYIGGCYYGHYDENQTNRFIEIIFSYCLFDKFLKISQSKWNRMCSVFADTILHEIIHMRQYRTRRWKILPGYESMAHLAKQRKDQNYYGHPDEIGAYAFNIACEMYDRFGTNYQMIKRYLNSNQCVRHKRTNYFRYLKTFDMNHSHRVIKKLKKKVTYYLPYAEFGKPFKTSDHINY